MMPTTLPIDFATWTMEQAAQAIDDTLEARVTTEGYTANYAYVELRDHWQNGDTWMGPDGGGSLALRSLVLKSVERQFTPVDVIGEVLDNIANALLQKEASVTFAPLVAPDDPESDAAKKLATEAAQMRELVSAWWDRRRLWELARKTTKRARWASRGVLRAWVAPTDLTTEGETRRLPSGLPFGEALEKVQLSAPEPEYAAVFEHPETNRRCALFSYVRGDGKEPAVELWFVDGADAVVRVLTTARAPEEHRIPLGGRLPIVQMEADLLITEPVRRQQARLNFFESLLTRVEETAGFPERYTLNAMPNGIWLDTPPTDGPPLETHTDDSGAVWYLHRAPRTLGAAITTDLRGVTTTDDDGKTRVQTPGVEFKEPTDPDFCIKASRHARLTLLRACKQGHLEMDGDATASGYSREQARATHEADLSNTKAPLEGMLRDLIEVVIAYAGQMSAEHRGFLDRFRCVVNVHVKPGPISAEERKTNETSIGKTLSQESAMARNGVEDTAAELAAIDADPRNRLDYILKQGQAAAAWVTAGAALEAAAELVGLSQDEAQKLLGTDLNRSVPQ